MGRKKILDYYTKLRVKGVGKFVEMFKIYFCEDSLWSKAKGRSCVTVAKPGSTPDDSITRI